MTPTASDLHRAAGLEKMARALHKLQECERAEDYGLHKVEMWAELDRTAHDYWRKWATAALAAWEAHCAEIQKAPAG